MAFHSMTGCPNGGDPTTIISLHPLGWSPQASPSPPPRHSMKSLIQTFCHYRSMLWCWSTVEGASPWHSNRSMAYNAAMKNCWKLKKLLLIVMKSGDGKELFLDKAREEKKHWWFSYYSHTTPIRISWSMGMVWEAYPNCYGNCLYLVNRLKIQATGAGPNDGNHPKTRYSYPKRKMIFVDSFPPIIGMVPCSVRLTNWRHLLRKSQLCKSAAVSEVQLMIRLTPWKLT